jgi:hypothetical protein
MYTEAMCGCAGQDGMHRRAIHEVSKGVEYFGVRLEPRGAGDARNQGP